MAWTISRQLREVAPHVRTIVQGNLEQPSHPGNLSSEILTSLFKDGDYNLICQVLPLIQLNEKQDWSALNLKPGLLPSYILGFATSDIQNT